MVFQRAHIFGWMLLLAAAPAFGAGGTFSFSLTKPAVTSGGVFASDGRLVRVLWSMEKLDAGTYQRQWDGKDQFDTEAPSGSYSYKVVLNGAEYRNVGAIGNSGFPGDPQLHTPAGMLSVAVDSDGSVYTANGWDENGADFKKWDKSGKSVYEAQFQIRNGQPNGAPYCIATDDEYLYCGMGGWADPTWKEAQQIQRFHRKDGKHEKFTKVGRGDGHIQIYEWPSKKVSASVPENEQEIRKAPLRAVAVLGSNIYVADALGDRILKFNKVTGEAEGEFKVPLPQGMAFDSSGRLWIGHSHHILSLYTASGQKVSEVLSDLSEIEAVATDGKDLLAVADSGASQVKVFTISGERLTPKTSLGKKAQPGDRDPSHFFHLRGVAIDADGGLTTVQTEPAGGARVARWSPDGKLAWEQFGCEFVSLGNYGTENPDQFYSMTFHDYRLLDHAAGKWEYTANGFGGVGRDASGARKYSTDPHGVPRVLKFGSQNFLFLATGDGVQVYRIDGKVLRLAALVGGRNPSPLGEKEGKELGRWTWHDAAGDSDPKPDQINWAIKPGQPGAGYAVYGIDIDSHGNIWFADGGTQSVWEIPIGPADARGNPTYDWKQAREVVKKDTTPLKFRPNMVQHADDGSLYAFGWSDRWPEPKNNPFWMGGTTLVRWNESGERLWAVKLPALCVGLDTVPGGAGGCFAGQGDGAKLHHFTADGLYVGLCAPGEPMAKQSGWLDNHASVAVNRDPRDKILDIFAEDDLVLRIGWYRVNDSEIKTLSGAITAR